MVYPPSLQLELETETIYVLSVKWLCKTTVFTSDNICSYLMLYMLSVYSCTWLLFSLIIVDITDSHIIGVCETIKLYDLCNPIANMLIIILHCISVEWNWCTNKEDQSKSVVSSLEGIPLVEILGF